MIDDKEIRAQRNESILAMPNNMICEMQKKNSPKSQVSRCEEGHGSSEWVGVWVSGLYNGPVTLVVRVACVKQ